MPSNAFATAAPASEQFAPDTVKLQTTFGLTLPAWWLGVDRMLAEIL